MTAGDRAVASETRLYLCPAGWEQRLLAELRRVFRNGDHAAIEPGWVRSVISAVDIERAVAVAFASQCMPDAESIAADSISKWVQLIGPRIIEGLRDHDAKWRLHVFGAERDAAGVSPRRLQLVQQGILELLRKKQRRLLRSLAVDDAQPWTGAEALVQVALITPSTGAFSVCHPEKRHRLRRCVSRFAAGRVSIPDDRRPPSRAYRKLREAQLRMGRFIQPGERCVDLGASPGGWTFEAARQGATVIAVDRSPLRDDLMRNPSVTFQKADAFRFKPQEPVDWLLSDVVAFPPRIVELLGRWIGERLCKRFCVTVKFRGQEDYDQLETIKSLLSDHPTDYCVRRLQANKNEATVYGWLVEQGDDEPAVSC